MPRKSLKYYFKFKGSFDNDYYYYYYYYLTVNIYNIIKGNILIYDIMIFKNNVLYCEKCYDENGKIK